MKVLANTSVFLYTSNMNFHNVLQAFTTANYREVLFAFLVGAVLGFIFIKLKLPIPAPPVLAGIMGIVGIWVGFLLGK